MTDTQPESIPEQFDVTYDDLKPLEELRRMGSYSVPIASVLDRMIERARRKHPLAAREGWVLVENNRAYYQQGTALFRKQEAGIMREANLYDFPVDQVVALEPVKPEEV